MTHVFSNENIYKWTFLHVCSIMTRPVFLFRKCNSHSEGKKNILVKMQDNKNVNPIYHS